MSREVHVRFCESRAVRFRPATHHVHVVATLARQDGRRVFVRNDFWRAGEASREVEAKYGLTVTAASDRTAAKRASYAEIAKAARRGQGEPVRDTLRRSVRTAAAGASSLGEFLERLRDDGLLVRERHSERNPGQVTGYAVALPESVDVGGQPIYFGGGKLAADLTLPKLRSRWEPAETDGSATAGAAGDATAGQPGQAASATSSASATTDGGASNDRHRLTPEERTRIWEQATAAAGRATEQVRAAAGKDPRGAGDAAWAASDFLASEPGSSRAAAAGRSPQPPPSTTARHAGCGAGYPPRRKPGRGCGRRRCCWPRRGSSAGARTPSCLRCSLSSPHCPTP